MRRFVWLLLLCLFISNTVGCVGIYSADPNRRARQLLFQSENMRALLDTWERIWFLDQPTAMSPTRTSGGVI